MRIKKSILVIPDAFKYGIGMIHQHFKLVDVFTCVENIVLGIEDKEKAKIDASLKEKQINKQTIKSNNK